jgi:hypothetical protein
LGKPSESSRISRGKAPWPIAAVLRWTKSISRRTTLSRRLSQHMLALRRKNGSHYPGRNFSRMAHLAHIAHRIPGRVRLRIPSARHDRATLMRLAQRTASLPGVKSVESNSATGSLLISYSRDMYHSLWAFLSAMTSSAEVASLLELPIDVELGEVAGVALGISTIVDWIGKRTLRSGTGATAENHFDLAVLLGVTITIAGVLIIAGAWPMNLLEL